MRRLSTGICIVICAAALAISGIAHAVTVTWENTGTAWGTGGNWIGDSVPTAADIAAFPEVDSGRDHPSIVATNFSILGVTIDNAGDQDYNIDGTTGVLTIGGSGLGLSGGGATAGNADIRVGAAQNWNIGAGGTFTQNGGFSGVNTLTKTGTGTLVLDVTSTETNTFVGGYVVSAGTLDVGDTTTVGSQVLRSNSISLSGTLTNTGGDSVTLGQLSGSGAATFSSDNESEIRMYIIADADYSGTMTLDNPNGSGGPTLDFRAGNDAVQTFSGNITGVEAVDGISISRGVTVRLTGTGSNGELSTNTPFTMRGGTLHLDNTGGENDRLTSSSNFTFLGGTLHLTGSGDVNGTAETVGSLTMNAGAARVQVTNNGGTGGTQLTFSSFARGSSLAGTVDFVEDGIGSFGAAGNNPRVIFTAAPSTVNGVIADGSIVGFATVNGSDFAGYGANGVVAVTSTLVSDALVSASTQNSRLEGNATIAGSSVLYNTLKIAPTSGGLSLDLTGAGNLSTSGILLTGSNDYTIQNTGGGTGDIIAGGSRFVIVSNPNTTLNVATSMISSTNSLTKGGEGFLALTGSETQIGGSGGNANIGINAGVLRGTLTSLGGGTAAGGANSTIQLRGGVLEISGVGTLTRALDLTGTGSGGGITFDQGATDQGGGGFSAIDGNVTVTLVTTVGGGTAVTPTSSGKQSIWGNGHFVPDGHALVFGSTKSDNSITLTNSFALDDTAGDQTNNPYVARDIRVVDNSGSSTDRAVLSGEISGTKFADLLKTGGGTLELSRAAGNSYAGNTLVVGGTLLANNSTGSATGTGLVKVSIDGTLGGTGSISGEVVIDDGGTLSPGESIESLAVNNVLTFKANGTFAYEINTTTPMTPSADLVFGVTSLDIVADSVLDIEDLALTDQGLPNGTKFTLISYLAGTWNGGLFDYEGSPVANETNIAVGPNTFFVKYDDTSAGSNFNSEAIAGMAAKNYLTITAVPEPGAVLFGVVACSLAGGGYLRRRLKRLTNGRPGGDGAPEEPVT